MKYLITISLALCCFSTTAQIIKPKTKAMLDSCLKLNSVLSSSFRKFDFESENGKVTGLQNVSFHYQNIDDGFKGICSNAQFSIDGAKIIGTVENQSYIFLWSAVLNGQSEKLSLDNINYTTERPINVQVWLNQNH